MTYGIYTPPVVEVGLTIRAFSGIFWVEHGKF
jgi:hypothetical protein